MIKTDKLVASIRGVAAAASVVFVEFRFGAPFGVISVVDDFAFEGRLGWTATAALAVPDPDATGVAGVTLCGFLVSINGS